MSMSEANANTPTQALHAHQVALLALATLAELRESDTESHLLRVQHYCRALCSELRTQSAWADVVSEAFEQSLLQCVPLYDLGTVGVPDRILLKPARLTPEELVIMRTHTTLGHDALQRAQKTLGVHAPLLQMAKEVALHHHEKFNGTGYPKGLSGSAIPAAARILALADVYDALISSKVYKDGIPHVAALQVIVNERGLHFDPDVVDAFVNVETEFATIAQQYADTEDDMQKKIEYLANAIAEVAEL
ncbi:MAG: HD-GYP domain-containing protein [Rhodoferax sp.]